MKIAYFSPFPPQQTGIALYSQQLVGELRRLMEVDCYDFDNDEATDPSKHFGDFAIVGRIKDLGACDAVVYHLGNNPHFHLQIFRTLRLWPGIVVLHDVVLYYLFAGLGPVGLRKHLCMVEGNSGTESMDEIAHTAPGGDLLRYPSPEKHPLTAAVFPYARCLVVHNQTARQRLFTMGYTGKIAVIPLLAFPSAETAATRAAIASLRQRHSLGADEIVVACLGFLGPTKRIAQLCGALGMIRDEIKFRLIIVGDGDDVSGLVSAAGLDGVTIRTGFVGAEEFSSYLGLTDILVNLRFPSMGESSATLTRAMELGKPSIVTRDAAFADLPDDAVYKIDLGPDEERDLAEAIRKLATDANLRARLGSAGQRYAREQLNPGKIAREYERVIAAESQHRAQSALMADQSADAAIQAAGQMLQDSIFRALPSTARQTVPPLSAGRRHASE
ncbi:MAG: glycosyltransferase [Verrucomicrobiota bacterium]|nr:glycosyltransferase [Verrucomicrobiota bacterium]